jgi:putative transposase
MHYRRSKTAGGTCFFTVTLADRTSDLLIQKIDLLREVIRATRHRHPFTIVAMVVLPDHLHSLWRLPPEDAEYPKRWSLIKSGFSRRMPKEESVSKSRENKRERGIWQRRYWEHQIRDETDLERHVDYIHFNPVKHGYVTRAVDWQYSSIHRFIANGWLTADWGTGFKIEAGEFASAGRTTLPY